MKTIIVPMDFSNESLTGLNLAIMMANKMEAKIQMVHVISHNDNMNSESLEKEHELAKMKFEKILQKCLEKSNLKIDLSYVIKVGKIFREIADMGDTFEDTLTILSAYGESGFEELFIGGNAYKITSHSRNPVITVRRNGNPVKY